MSLKQSKIGLLYNKLKGKKQDGNEEKPLMKNRTQTDGKTLSSSFIIAIDLKLNLCILSEKPTCFHGDTMRGYCFMLCIFAWFDESRLSLGLHDISKGIHFHLLLD